MAPLKVGLMGYGFSTLSFHLPFILPNPDLEVYAFLQRRDGPKEKGKHCTVDYPHAKWYQQPAEFFADPAIDLVIVCTHHDTHAEFAELALNAGKHVVVEKPFTVNTVEADKIIALSKEKGKILTCYQNRRYDSGFRTLSKLVKANAFGKVTEFESHYDMSFPAWVQGWKSPEYEPGNGMMYGLGTHSIDQALQLFGKPKSVTAFLRSLRGVESKTEDSFTIILQYDGEHKELISTIKTTIVSPQLDQQSFWIRGYDGSYSKQGEEDPQEIQVSKGMKATDSGFGEEDPVLDGLLTTVKEFDGKVQKAVGDKYVGKYPTISGSYCDYYVDLVAAIKGDKALVVKPEESRDGLKVIELARESSEKGITMAWS